GSANVAPHCLMDALKNDFPVGAVHPQHTFIAQHAVSVNLQQAAQEFIQLCDIEGTVAAEHKCRDALGMVFMRMVMVAVFIAIMIMVMRMVMILRIQKGGIDFQLVIEIEAANVEYLLQRGLAKISMRN